MHIYTYIYKEKHTYILVGNVFLVYLIIQHAYTQNLYDMYMIFDYYYYYIIRYYDRKLNNTQQRLDFSSCFLVFVIPKIDESKNKTETIQILYMYIYDLCVLLDINYYKTKKEKQKPQQCPKILLLTTIQKKIYMYMLVGERLNGLIFLVYVENAR